MRRNRESPLEDGWHLYGDLFEEEGDGAEKKEGIGAHKPIYMLRQFILQCLGHNIWREP